MMITSQTVLQLAHQASELSHACITSTSDNVQYPIGSTTGSWWKLR